MEIKTGEVKRLAKKLQFSTLRNKKLEGLGLKIRSWRKALKSIRRKRGILRYFLWLRAKR